MVRPIKDMDESELRETILAMAELYAEKFHTPRAFEPSISAVQSRERLLVEGKCVR